jgi:Family of unknown function (DUF6402)
MSGIYKPGWLSREYRQLSRTQRVAVSHEVDRRFREQTGVGRRLDPTSSKDLELRRTWLRIRDAVVSMPGGEETPKEYLEREEMSRDSVLTSIPGEMEWEHWNQGAELLETWFERPRATAPSYSAPVTNVIKMDWVLQFDRTKSVYEKILKEKIWTNSASQKRMAEILKQKPRSAGLQWGDLSKPVTDVDEGWINARPVLSGSSPDALAAALGSFELQVAIAGKVLSIGGGVFEVSIEEVGIYVKDSFDFNGDQFLGIWGYRDDPINNSDFRKWRADNHLGGDFRVFSDVKRVRLNPPDLVNVRL